MTGRPTYEELEQGVMALEKEAGKRKEAEEELRDKKQKWMSLMENTTDFIMIIDDKGKIQYINRTIPPHTVNQVTGKTLYDFAVPEDHEMIRQAVARVFETREQGSYTSSVKHPTGIHWFETTMIPIIEDEKAKSALSFNKIITGRKRAEEALRESEERFRDTVTMLPSVIIEYGLDGILTYVNPHGYELAGYVPEDFEENFNVLQLVVPEEHGKHYERIQRMMQGEKIPPTEYRLLRKDGSIFWGLVTSSLIHKDGEVVGVRTYTIDISERKEAEEALKERTRELELQKKSLKELNTAMKILLKKREDDKTEIEENVMTNVKKLIVPYFEKINKTKLDYHQKAFLNILESNLNEIVSPFTRKLSLKYLSLTPREITIVNMIKQGYTTKKIAKLMNISHRTVDTHRKNIRSKIGLNNKRGNLRSHLLACEQ